jgi:hypothetical protein
MELCPYILSLPMGDAESERALSSWDNKNQIYKK